MKGAGTLCAGHLDHGSSPVFSTDNKSVRESVVDLMASKTLGNHCQPVEMPAADKPELLSVDLGRSQGLGVLMAKLFLPTLTSCTASGSVPGITFPGPSLLGSTSPASTECIHRYLTQINEREFLEIKSAISSRQSEKSHDLS